MRNKYKVTAITLVAAIMFVMFFSFQVTYAADSSKESNTIALVYDDSSSMMNSVDNVFVERWCHAKYALEVFSTMMLDNDVMTVYPMNNSKDKFTVNGSDSAKNRRDRIEKYEEGCYDATPYAQVEAAYKNLKANKDDSKKWLVILTDGSFSDKKSDEVNSDFNVYAENGVNVVYLRIFDDNNKNIESYIKNNPDKGIYAYEAIKSSDTLEKVNDISNLIFKRQALSSYDGVMVKNGNSLTLNIDAPVSQLIVFAQGDNIKIGDLKGKSSLKPVSSIEVKTPKIPKNVGNYKRSDIVVAKGLGGVITTFSNTDGSPIEASKYTIDVSDLSNVEVYCKLAASVMLDITQDKKSAKDDGNIFIGDYKADIKLVHPVTGKEISKDAKLLSDIKYNINVTNEYKDSSGAVKTDTKTFDENGFTGNLKHGKVSFDGILKIGDTYTEFDNSYKVIEKVDELSIEYGVLEDGINLEELDAKKQGIPIKILEGGNTIKKAHLDKLKLNVSTANKIKYDLVKGKEDGTFTLYPMYDGSIEKTDSGKVVFDIKAELDIDGQKKTAEAEVKTDIYVKSVPLGINVENTNSYMINNLFKVKRGESIGDIKSDEKPIVIDCKMDGKSFTEEEWKSAKVKVDILDSKTKQALDGKDEDFDVYVKKGTGKDASKVYVIPVNRKSGDLFFFRNRDVKFKVSVSYKRLGVLCKGAKEASFTVKPDLKKLIFRWAVLLIIILLILIYLYGMTFGKCWNKPKPVIIKKEWTRKTGDMPDIKNEFEANVIWSTVFIPFKDVEWYISPSAMGAKPLHLRAMTGSYKVLNMKDLVGKDIQKNGMDITDSMKPVFGNSTKVTYWVKNTPTIKKKYILKLHR